ncbi:LysE family translocator [Pseudomonas sp. N040]|uniref:LysE family translocator n=1 Tax=Pseudomonas sp. N040 TaxID=2785325 RepID=UPI0018A2E7CE|nr:LysE family translocator [Pseudomonas sp. N040]MBF7731247.1 LysE family translocator [Pseudomonas sp. N040]MBW7014890.1 LysE family translocator [Pseudomonas sp. N040]
MSLLNLIAMASFAFVTSVTPGPNNLLLLASGANFGFRRTLPHIFGISVGMALLLTCVLGGLGELFSRFPLLQVLLRIAGVGYLLWLSWKILQTPPRGEQADIDRGRPFAWWQAVIFQFINPKAWIMAITAVSSFTLAGEAYWTSGLALVLVFAVVNLPAISAWAGFGTLMQRFLSTAARQLHFNRAMATLTALTVVMLVQQ